MISRFLRAVSTHILPGIQAFSRFSAICSGTRPARHPGPSRLRRTATPLRPPPPACAQPVPTAGPRSRGGLVCSFLGAELRFHISREVLSRVTCVDQVLIPPRARWPCCEFRGSLAPPHPPFRPGRPLKAQTSLLSRASFESGAAAVLPWASEVRVLDERAATPAACRVCDTLGFPGLCGQTPVRAAVPSPVFRTATTTQANVRPVSSQSATHVSVPLCLLISR